MSEVTRTPILRASLLTQIREYYGYVRSKGHDTQTFSSPLAFSLVPPRIGDLSLVYDLRQVHRKNVNTICYQIYFFIFCSEKYLICFPRYNSNILDTSSK